MEEEKQASAEVKANNAGDMREQAELNDSNRNNLRPERELGITRLCKF